MGKRNKKARNKRLGPQNPAAREETAAAAFGLPDLAFDDFDDPIPMTYQGRVITPEVIAQMRAQDPEHADQIDAEWEAMVLENNRPWLEDHGRLQDTEQTWDWARQAFPGAFTDCGCEDEDQAPDPEQETSGRSREQVRDELVERLARMVPTEGLDPVQILLRVEGMNSIEDFEATDAREWRIDGRPLTREEMLTVLEMEPTDFMRYHLAQEGFGSEMTQETTSD
ncbi:hypothetical protein BDW27_12364 [Nocardiopsis sp. L17-MgMaSL7]|nr:hypothetical protein BDW27_12364 [Nocardiopsis sp. L17-MgMaSL7]